MRPRQARREDQSQVSPGPHMAHDHEPAQAFVEKVAQGLIIGNRQNSVGLKFDFVALFGDEAAHQQIVGRTVLNRFIAAESGQPRARGGDGRPQRKLLSVKLTRDQDAGIEVGKHTNRLEIFGEYFLCDMARRAAWYHPLPKSCGES